MRPLEEFLGEETAGAAVLFIAATIAIIWANLPGDSYVELWRREAGRDFGDIHLRLTVVRWVNDALMALFFFVVGLEIKREVLTGELSEKRSAALPVFAAAGGMLAPALIYLGFTAGDGPTRGAGVPIATDIAFAIGALSLLGERVPSALKAFLLALAIVDDIGGIAVIAIFYTDDLSLTWLAAAAAILSTGAALSRLDVRIPIVYAAIGVAAWICVHESDVHASITGVAIALLLPVRYGANATGSFIDRAEEAIHPWTSYFVVPLFALANAGVELGGEALRQAVTSRVSLGVALGLIIGKPAGIALFSLAAVRAGLATMPSGTGPLQLLAAGALAGIGFTVSIFIAELAFDGPLLDEAKLGVLAGSLCSGIIGYGVLRAATRRRPSGARQPIG